MKEIAESLNMTVKGVDLSYWQSVASFKEEPQRLPYTLLFLIEYLHKVLRH